MQHPNAVFHRVPLFLGGVNKWLFDREKIEHEMAEWLMGQADYGAVVVELGANVTGLQVGDIVSGEGHIVCGRCRNCLAGRLHLCPNTQGVGVNRDGAFAEYVVIPATNVFRPSVYLPTDLLSIFDPYGNAVHTALSFKMVGEDVIITGAGPIGIMAAMVAGHCGARNVILTDVNEYRLDLAKRIVPKVQPINVAKQEITRNFMESLGILEGFDVCLETVSYTHLTLPTKA